MSIFHRLFCKAETPVTIEHLCDQIDIAPTVGGEADDWFWAEFDVGTTIRIERFHVEEEGIRAELNAWAAYVEACEEADPSLMERIVQSRHLITLQYPEESDAEVVRVARWLTGRIAQTMDGVYQVDGEGIFSAEGNLLAPLTEIAEPE